MRSLTTRTVAGLFFLSGCASLIYQVVWMRMLIRVFGVTTLAVSTIIAVFMSGLALGAWLGGRRSGSDARGLRTYSFLELGAALAGCAGTALLLQLPEWYAAVGGPSVFRPALRVTLSAAALLPPTMLMGATLPVLTRYVAEREESAGIGLAVLYGWNTLGAVVGMLGSGFVLLAALGEIRTVGCAVALNLVCALSARLASRRFERTAVKEADRRRPEPLAASEGLLLTLFFASGFGALGLEVLWSRLIVLLVGSSVYAYSLLLACVLSGIGIGGVLSALWMKRGPSRREALSAYGGLQIGVAFSVALGLAAYQAAGLAAFQPRYVYSPFQGPVDLLFFLRDCAMVSFVPSLLMGLSFPLAGPLLARGNADAGRAAGRAFAVNTIGGVLGSVIAGFLLVPAIGVSGGAAVFVALAGVCGLAALAAAGAEPRARRIAGAGLAAAVVSLGWAWNPARSILVNRIEKLGGEISFYTEQTAASVAGLETDAVDLVSGVFDAFPWFWKDAAEVRSRPGVKTHVDDGRHYLLTTPKRFDLIVVDGTPPVWSARTVNLYTREFVGLGKSRLAEKGILAIWIPVPMLTKDFGVVLRNFTDAFEHAAMWSHPGGPGFLFMGSNAPMDSSASVVLAGYRRLEIARHAPSLTEKAILGGVPFTGAELRRIGNLFPPLTDDRPYTEFPLGDLLRGEKFKMNTVEIVRRLDMLGRVLGTDE
ncbi:MAG: hypothetical protein CO113_15100 [Elusimicrobia bacterium CG_4_9_14_3_um_filter_62_55]|nr:MAG: hypothetical protein COR54_09195 [Elusimicrobia bacterium CG22_combo_CG10-13_8_21_14_all_63_91]PJA17958.1 MAG: hypothetical protein COX66_02775 [Elusimicrobia bacterium CG_4_10_14_0_2_um_filter_63_34]PJB24203.1 MAG: hypothetical protein CO113_15100 [Elusimicrobia bacterium CG_4_9_14_3_um_filter_62_55]